MPGNVHYGANLDSWLIHGTKEEGDSLMFGMFWSGATKHEYPVGQVTTGGPDLLTIQNPLIPI